MTTEYIDLPDNIPLARFAERLEALGAAEGLHVTLRGTLAQSPGSIHWHFKKRGAQGILEATLLNRERRIILAVHDNRTGPWTADALTRFAAALETGDA